MKRIIVVALVLAFLSFAQSPDDPKSGQTGGRLNGYGWLKLTEGERAAYMRGAADALLIERPENYGRWFPSGTLPEITAEVARFYASDFNRVTPFLNALNIIKSEQTKKTK